MKVSVYKCEIYVIDFEDIGPERINAILSNKERPYWTVDPIVSSLKRQTTWWTPRHTLDRPNYSLAECKELFKLPYKEVM